MTERDALDRAILEHPDDDTTRLAMASWLDDNGEQDRGEFIKVQVELANRANGCHHQEPSEHHGVIPWCNNCGKRWGLRSRERALFAAHGAEWFGPGAVLEIPKFYASIGYTYIVPARGFPAHWYGPWERWVGGGYCTGCSGGVTGWYGEYPCEDCLGSGRIPGACETLAWRKGWEMECNGCYVGGVTSEPDGYTVKIEHQVWGSYDRTEDYPKKPLCRLCRGKRRVPRPVPSEAVPLSTINLTTWPSVEEFSMYGCVSSSREGAQTVATFKSWPGLRFHLPSGRWAT
jgi:uncharacterized protein (TIGR02996 family)